jgi:hypothetical protein
MKLVERLRDLYSAEDLAELHFQRWEVKLDFRHSPSGSHSPWQTLLKLVACQKVPYRPERLEPRVKKRRPKSYPLMTKARAQLKTAIGG